ncbi:MAG: co-chaperone GroES, partial [Minisyncoccia bacterium]
LSNHLFIEPIEEEKTTKSGIVLPETAEKERPIRGRIIAIGPGKLNEKGERIPMSVKVGDIVLFKKYGPDEVELDGKKYLVGDEDDILAIIE